MFRLIRWYWRLRGNKIHHTAIIYPCVRMGKGNYIGPFCIIGAQPEYKGHEYDGKGVMIGNNVRMTGLVTIDSGVHSHTYIHSNCYLMKHSHIAHDVTIYTSATISCGVKLGGYAVIGENTNLGLNSCVHQRVWVPHSCMIGMGAIITKKTDLKPNTVYIGNPARELRENII